MLDFQSGERQQNPPKGGRKKGGRVQSKHTTFKIIDTHSDESREEVNVRWFFSKTWQNHLEMKDTNHQSCKIFRNLCFQKIPKVTIIYIGFFFKQIFEPMMNKLMNKIIGTRDQTSRGDFQDSDQGSSHGWSTYGPLRVPLLTIGFPS